MELFVVSSDGEFDAGTKGDVAIASFFEGDNGAFFSVDVFFFDFFFSLPSCDEFVEFFDVENEAAEKESFICDNVVVVDEFFFLVFFYVVFDV